MEKTQNRQQILDQLKILNRLRKCIDFLEIYRGRTVSQAIAKRMYKMSKGLYDIAEYRLNDHNSLVSMQIAKGLKKDNQPKFFFLVKGKLGKKLNMCD